jgi:hypothetical protein
MKIPAVIFQHFDDFPDFHNRTKNIAKQTSFTALLVSITTPTEPDNRTILGTAKSIVNIKLPLIV